MPLGIRPFFLQKMNIENNLITLTQQLGTQLQQKNWQLCCAESCTGGGLAQTLTDIAGSSSWFDRGFVTYSNAAKHEMLGVSLDLIASKGAVSLAVVEAMAKGALTHSHAQISVAISGIAGPGGGSLEKPIGTVCLAWAYPDSNIYAKQYHFDGNRQAVRHAAIQKALIKLLNFSQ